MMGCMRMMMLVWLLGCGKMQSKSHDVVRETTTYYVSNDGADGQTGTREAPMQTINGALAKAKPGDTVFVRGGTYYEKVLFPKSGQLNKVITLKSFPGEQPVIDGSGLSISGKDALVKISNVSYVHIEGFEICNFKSSTPGVDVNGIVVDGTSGNIRIADNHIHHIENNAAPAGGRSGHAIEVLGNTTVAITDILIEGNEIHDCNTGYSENLTINGYVDGFVVRKNRIYNGENIGIVAAGGYAANANPALNYARNGLIAENEVFNIDGTTGPIPAFQDNHGAISIYVDGARSIVIERNWIHGSDRGIGIVSENDNFPTEDCIVRNNVVQDCFLTGIYLGGYLRYTGGGTRNCYVVNNTLVMNNRVHGYYDEIEGEIRLTENCMNNVIRNNLIYTRQDGVFVHKYNASGSGNIIDNNVYDSPGGATWIWEGAQQTVFSAWQGASQQDASSLSGKDPQFVNAATGDFRLETTSPAISAGVVIDAGIHGDVDFGGQPRMVGGTIDVGAYQHHPDR